MLTQSHGRPPALCRNHGCNPNGNTRHATRQIARCEETGEGIPILFLHEYAATIAAGQIRPAISAGATDLFLKRIMPSAQLAILPGSGHVFNYEEPALFKHLIERFLSAVDRGSMIKEK